MATTTRDTETAFHKRITRPARAAGPDVVRFCERCGVEVRDGDPDAETRGEPARCGRCNGRDD